MATGNLSQGKGLHLAHLNVRSMFGGHKFDVLKNQICNSGVDFFTISETWLNAAIPDKIIEVPNYTVTRLDRSWSGNQSNLPKNREVALHVS